MVEIECTIESVDRNKIHPSQSAVVNSQVGSSNWSGYAAASPNFLNPTIGAVTYAAGCWMVPALIPTPDTSYCAIWVGIDGFFDNTVEQIGTAHNWVDGVQENYAWFEMYPNGAFALTGFPVNVGDEISVRVAYKGDNVFKLVMFNHTQGVMTTVPASFTTTANAQRTSAEWVVEAPFSGGVLPLSDFGLTTFNYCSANMSDGKGSINNNPLWSYDSIVMENSSGPKAVPSVLLKGGTCFTVDWKQE
jgi:hypothetical protein